MWAIVASCSENRTWFLQRPIKFAEHHYTLSLDLSPFLVSLSLIKLIMLQWLSTLQHISQLAICLMTFVCFLTRLLFIHLPVSCWLWNMVVIVIYLYTKFEHEDKCITKLSLFWKKDIWFSGDREQNREGCEHKVVNLDRLRFRLLGSWKCTNCSSVRRILMQFYPTVNVCKGTEKEISEANWKAILVKFREAKYAVANKLGDLKRKLISRDFFVLYYYRNKIG